VLVCDEHGTVQTAGGIVHSLLGIRPEEALGRPLWDVLVDAQDAPRLRDALAACHGTGVGCSLEVASRPRAAGSRLLEVEVAPLLAAGGARAVCVVAREPVPGAADEALTQSEERYRRLVDACPEPIVVHAGGRIRFVNPAAVALLGADSTVELLDRPVMDFVHPDYRAVVGERMRKMLETGRPAYLLEEKIVRPDGVVLDVEIAGAPISFQGEPAIQLVGRDVTARRRADAERRELEDRVREARRRESLLRLAEGVAHQLSELSATLLDTVDASLARPDRPRRTTEVMPIRRVGLRMAQLTEQLLGFVGKEPAKGDPVNLSALVLELSERLEGELGAGAQLSYDLPVDLPVVRVDPIRMRRIVCGLVRNAADALSPRVGTITVRTRAIRPDAELLARIQPPGALREGHCVALEVRDTGCGMDAPTAARALDPFFSTKSPGRGLGLSEVLGLVGTLGGGLDVASAPGRGTTVRLLFPALPEGADPAEPAVGRSGRRRPVRGRRPLS
jgi:PAS domain S-box-containing protein